ncbi:MAG TPA: DUF177 domain-containing protein [Micropepsaceae bacterium]|jgi:uncharacterized metal-binding protein YceD (DUF177 family)
MVFAAPYSLVFDLGLVPKLGTQIVLDPTQAERAAISGWLGIEDLESLTAMLLISRDGENHYSCAANFEADVVQACVVTLEPVRAHLSGTYHRLFQVLPRSSSRRKNPVGEPPSLDVPLAGEDGPELLDNSVVDLAAPLLEELSLALDPYPRAPGVSFAPPVEEVEPADNPFAVLEQLKAPPSPPARSVKPEIGTKPASAGRKRR